MSLPSRRLSLSVLAVALAAATLPAAAQGGQGRQDESQGDNARSGNAGNDAVSDAVRRFERANRGQVLSAERMQFDGRDVTRIKAVGDDGRVRVFMDDPQPAADVPRSQNRDQPQRPPRGERRD